MFPGIAKSFVRMMIFRILFHELDSSPGHRPYHDRLAVGNNGHQSLENTMIRHVL
jgi:hypothetical protein